MKFFFLPSTTDLSLSYFSVDLGDALYSSITPFNPGEFVRERVHSAFHVSKGGRLFFHRPYRASSRTSRYRSIIHLWRPANNGRFHGIPWWLLYSITNLRHARHTTGNFRESRLSNEPWILQDIAERDVPPERYCRAASSIGKKFIRENGDGR